MRELNIWDIEDELPTATLELLVRWVRNERLGFEAGSRIVARICDAEQGRERDKALAYCLRGDYQGPPPLEQVVYELMRSETATGEELIRVVQYCSERYERWRSAALPEDRDRAARRILGAGLEHQPSWVVSLMEQYVPHLLDLDDDQRERAERSRRIRRVLTGR